MPRKRFLPVSLSQEQLFLFGQLFGGGDFLNMPYAYRLTGPLDVSALHRAIQEIVRRHATLRSGFTETNGEARQFVRHKVNIGLPFIDLSRLPKEILESELDRLSKADARQTFDLEKPPLLRVKLLRLADERHVLLVTMHHIITDQGSMDLFRKELALLYETISQGLPVALAGLADPVQRLHGVAAGNSRSPAGWTGKFPIGAPSWASLHRGWNFTAPKKKRRRHGFTAHESRSRLARRFSPGSKTSPASDTARRSWCSSQR